MKRFGIALGAALLLAGCGSKPGIVGKWKVDPQMAAPAGLPAGFMTGFAMTFKYEFKGDNTFSAPMSTGTYTLDGSKLSMTTKTVLGRDVSSFGAKAADAVMTGELAADGQSLTIHPVSLARSMPALANIKMVPDK